MFEINLCAPLSAFISHVCIDAEQQLQNDEECILPHIQGSFQESYDDRTNIKHVTEIFVARVGSVA